MLAVMPPRAHSFEAHAQPPMSPPRTGTELHHMFPDIDQDVLSQMLSANGGDIEATVCALLGEPLGREAAIPLIDVLDSSEMSPDYRRLQMEQDAEYARNVHEKLQRELRADSIEAEKAKAEKMAHTSLASRAMNSATHTFMKRVTRPNKASAASPPLLEAHLAENHESTTDAAYDMCPLDAPSTYAPPSAMATDSPTAGLTTSHPSTTNEDSVSASSVYTSGRYSSRLDRARSANRQRTHVRLAQAVPATATIPEAVDVPEGQLI